MLKREGTTKTKRIKLFEHKWYLLFSCNLYDSNTRSVYWILVLGSFWGELLAFFSFERVLSELFFALVSSSIQLLQFYINGKSFVRGHSNFPLLTPCVFELFSTKRLAFENKKKIANRSLLKKQPESDSAL